MICAIFTPFRTAFAFADNEASALYARAERDDRAFSFSNAAAEYEEALRLDPTMPTALRAEERAKSIRSHAEGDDYKPLIMLEHVRRDPVLSSDPKAIDDLVRASYTFPPGLVRIEVWVLAAEAYAHRLSRPDDAVPLWRAIATDPKTDPVIVRNAQRFLATYYLSHHDYASAESILSLVPVTDAKLLKDVHRVIRRHYLHLASIFMLATLLVMALLSLGRAARDKRARFVFDRVRASRNIIVAYGAYVAILGALLATGYESGTGLPFLVYGLVLVPLLLISRAWGAAGARARLPRSMRATLCGVSALGAAFLVLETVDVGYLEGIGL